MTKRTSFAWDLICFLIGSLVIWILAGRGVVSFLRIEGLLALSIQGIFIAIGIYQTVQNLQFILTLIVQGSKTTERRKMLELVRGLKRVDEQAASLIKFKERAIEALGAASEALGEVEFVLEFNRSEDGQYSSRKICPWCGGGEGFLHKDDCIRQIALEKFLSLMPVK